MRVIALLLLNLIIYLLFCTYTDVFVVSHNRQNLAGRLILLERKMSTRRWIYGKEERWQYKIIIFLNSTWKEVSIKSILLCYIVKFVAWKYCILHSEILIRYISTLNNFIIYKANINFSNISSKFNFIFSIFFCRTRHLKLKNNKVKRICAKSIPSICCYHQKEIFFEMKSAKANIF